MITRGRIEIIVAFASAIFWAGVVVWCLSKSLPASRGELGIAFLSTLNVGIALTLCVELIRSGAWRVSAYMRFKKTNDVQD